MSASIQQPVYDTLILHKESEQDMGRRRGQRKGWLREDKGAWLLTFRDYGLEGSPRITKTIGPAKGAGKLTKKQAERFAWDHYLEKIDRSTRMPMSVITLEKFWAQHYEKHLERDRKYATVSQYKSLWRTWLSPVIGKIRLFELTPSDIDRAINVARTNKKSSGTAKHIKKVASSVISYAKALRMFSGDNPAQAIEAPVHVAVRKPRSMTVEQAREWTEMVTDVPADPKDKRSDIRPLRTMSLLGICCSLGISEQLGLTWQFVNLEDEPIIAGTDNIEPRSIGILGHSYHGRSGSLKTGNRRRFVPLPAILVESLLEIKRQTPWSAPEDPVFSGLNGKPIWADNLQKRYLKPLAADLKMPWLSWHVFRHTCATFTKNHQMLEPDRQVLMGHAPATMTDRYTHADRERLRAGVERIAAEVIQPSKKKLEQQKANVVEIRKKPVDSDSQLTSAETAGMQTNELSA